MPVTCETLVTHKKAETPGGGGGGGRENRNITQVFISVFG